MSDKEIIATFSNYFWVNTPTNWIVQLSNDSSHIKINITIPNKVNKNNPPCDIIERRYSIELLKKYCDNIDNVAKDCVTDVYDALNKRKKDRNEK